MSQEQKELQQKLSITPKTATLLIQAGYHDYRDLKDASPNRVVTQFTGKLGIPQSSASAYKRALRRLVWLATQDNPEDSAKVCADWTNKALKARGVWRDDFDELSGTEIAQLLSSVPET